MIRTPADLTGQWLDEYEERAGIMEYDGGMARPEAEAMALRDTIRRMTPQPTRYDGPGQARTMQADAKGRP